MFSQIPYSHLVCFIFCFVLGIVSISVFFFFNVSLLLFILSYKARKAVEVSQFVLLKKFFFVLNYIHNHFVVPSFSVNHFPVKILYLRQYFFQCLVYAK